MLGRDTSLSITATSVTQASSVTPAVLLLSHYTSVGKPLSRL